MNKFFQYSTLVSVQTPPRSTSLGSVLQSSGRHVWNARFKSRIVHSNAIDLVHPCMSFLNQFARERPQGMPKSVMESVPIWQQQCPNIPINPSNARSQHIGVRIPCPATLTLARGKYFSISSFVF